MILWVNDAKFAALGCMSSVFAPENFKGLSHDIILYSRVGNMHVIFVSMQVNLLYKHDR